MAKEKKNGSESEEEVEETEDTEEEETEEEEESAEDSDDAEDDESEEEESEDEDESEDESDEDELDLDAELEKERKAGEPDPVIAEQAFKDRKNKKKDGSVDGDKPLTQKDLDAALARDRKERQHADALAFAKEMTRSDKEAELVVAKWANRTFPKNLSLRDQIQEAFVITHAKKLVGERNEALRGLKGKQGISKNSADTHRAASKGAANEPKLPPGEMAVIKQSGFAWDSKNRDYRKKLPNGRILVRDPKTKTVVLLKK